MSESELDLALAAELQAALLPRACPLDCPNHAIGARNRMCRNIGGDFYDFVSINEDQAVIVIGDVVGHGVRSSLVMAQIIGWLRSAPHRLSRPAETVRLLNQMLIDLGERVGTPMPCSMFYLLVDHPTGMAFFANAGHPHPLLTGPGLAAPTGVGPWNMLLGVDDFEPQEGCHTFESGQRMVMFTDGVTDATNARGDLFGAARLETVLEEHRDATPQQACDAVFDAIAAFRDGSAQADDETIVILDRV